MQQKSKSEIISLVKKQTDSGLSIKQWCHENNIAPSTFSNWKRKYLSVKSRPDWIKLDDSPPRKSSYNSTIEVNSIKIFTDTPLTEILKAVTQL